MSGYPIPAETIRIENRVVNSRFIATIGPAATVDEARAFIAAVRDEMPDASHHVYAFIAGYGQSVIEGLSDDGEPTGTSGPPVMAVLRGSGIGDIVIVVTRYFGGTKLGTGGLVRAYGDAARDAIAALPTIRKIARTTVGLELAYAQFEPVKRMLDDYEAVIDEQDFGALVTLYVTLPSDNLTAFTDTLREMTAGQVTPTILSEQDS